MLSHVWIRYHGKIKSSYSIGILEIPNKVYINGEYRASSSTDIIKALIPDPKGFQNIVLAMEGGFLVNDNGKPKVNEKTFHYDVSNRMKKDMDDAFIRLLGKDDSFEFTFGTKQGTIVDGAKKNSRPGYNSDLCLRIDYQDSFTETVAGKKMEIANIQIQLNQKIRPSTIAQVHFQCGVKIPGDVIKRAFEKSWTEKKIIYVYRNVKK